MNNKGFTAIEALFGIIFLMATTGLVFGGYIAGSGITSTFKVATQMCGQKMHAETVFNGDWFCPKEPKLYD